MLEAASKTIVVALLALILNTVFMNGVVAEHTIADGSMQVRKVRRLFRMAFPEPRGTGADTWQRS